jgi:hypothetical protein
MKVRPHYPFHFYAPLRDYFASRKPEHSALIEEVMAWYEAGCVPPEAQDDIYAKMERITREVEPEYRKTRPRDGCPDCRYDGVFRFGAGADEQGYLKTLRPKRKLKFGELLACSGCGALWTFDGIVYQVVPRTQEAIVEEWNRKDLSPSAAIRGVLAEIGVDPGFPGSDSFTYPSKVKVGGAWLDFASVSLQRHPPLIFGSEAVRCVYLDEVEAVAPSEYALSAELRRHLQRSAEEAGREYHFVPVAAPDGSPLRLSSAATFFDARGLKGSRLSIPSSGRDSGSGDLESGCSPLLLVVADWVPDPP